MSIPNNNFYSKITYVLHVVDNVTLKNTKRITFPWSSNRGHLVTYNLQIMLSMICFCLCCKRKLGIVHLWMNARAHSTHTYKTPNVKFLFHSQISPWKYCSVFFTYLLLQQKDRVTKKWIVSFKKTPKYLFVYVTHNYFPYGSNIIRHNRHNTREWVKWYLKCEFQSWLHITPSKPYYTEVDSRTIVNCT